MDVLNSVGDGALEMFPWFFHTRMGRLSSPGAFFPLAALRGR